MKLNTIYLLILLFHFHTINGQSQEVILTNQSIIELTNAKLSKALIIGTIENSGSLNFDTSNEGLIELSKNSVDEDVILYMIEKQKTIDKSTFRIGNVVIDQPGLYIIDSGDNLINIPSHISDASVGRTLVMKLDNPESKTVLPNNFKTLYYFNRDESSKTNNDVFLASVGNPNEARMVRFNKERKVRELEVGKFKMSGIKFDIPEKNRIEFEVSEVKPNVYKIDLEQNLNEGEYGLIFGNINPGASTRVFDFSIR